MMHRDQTSAMDIGAASKLTELSEGQKAALALVAQYKSSKEIARVLGISPHTVDQRMKRVQAILGVHSRFEAARIFVAASALSDDQEPDSIGTSWGDLIYHTSDIPITPDSGQVQPSAADRNPAADGAMTLHQAQAAYADGFVGWKSDRAWHSVLLEAGQANELTVLARAVCIGGIALLAVLSLAAVVSLAEGLSRIF
jgi:DNA-binding CsgD family transcriptional regulator